jgi:asparagine synthase (glutamine-hydrolysing)
MQIANRAVVVSAAGEALKVTGTGEGTTALCQGVIGETGEPVAAFTIVSDGGRDAHVAAQLAQRYSMKCEFVNVVGLTDLDPAQAYELAMTATHRLDGLGRPLSAAVFAWAESQVAQAPRLSGHGGELARALFGAGVEFDRPHATVRAEVVDSYIRRWIVSNDAVPDNVLQPEFAAESRHLAMRRLREAFHRERAGWLEALNDFYLRQRMQRWAGITLTDGCLSRTRWWIVLCSR